jgi:hypothetical protein
MTRIGQENQSGTDCTCGITRHEPLMQTRLQIDLTVIKRGEKGFWEIDLVKQKRFFEVDDD